MQTIRGGYSPPRIDGGSWEWTIAMSNTSRKKSRVSRAVALAAGACALTLFAQIAAADINEQDARARAKRIHDRIAGVPPSETVLDNMANRITNNDPVGAAELATEDPAFYSVTLKNFVTPWTNRDQTVFAPLNDYTATVIGMVRDDKPFNTALSANILYIVRGSQPSATSNDHYAQAETNGVDLKAMLEETTQTAVYGTPDAATAGLMTTRAASAAFFIAGTNRAMFRFTLLNHLCKDLEQVQDTSRPPDRIRQDVSRSPGGDSRIFLNNCIGCHSGMDPMAQAFASYDYVHDGDDETQGRLVYTPGVVNPKYFINPDNFKPGFVTPDDKWENRWRQGPNQVLGWNPALPGQGSGAKSLGEELAASTQFAQCQVEKVFKAVCFRAPASTQDRDAIDAIRGGFMSGYRLKRVFAETAAYCMGQ